MPDESSKTTEIKILCTEMAEFLEHQPLCPKQIEPGWHLECKCGHDKVFKKYKKMREEWNEQD